MKKIIIFLIGALLLTNVGLFAKELDFTNALGKSKYESKLIDEDYFIWGASPIKGDDGKYHLFYSQWKKEDFHNAWVINCVIMHAVSDKPTGPWKTVGLALGQRDTNDYWDSSCVHNPSIKKFGDKYYLYYMGNVGDGKITEALNWKHRNNQRIGVAVSDSLYGPWKRSDEPLIDISKDKDAPDATCTTNPSVTQMADGKFLMIYKAVGAKRPAPAYGPVVHLAAISDRPDGGFKKMLKPIFTVEGIDFPAEDPYIWYRKGDGYYAIVKDFRGSFCEGYKGQMVLALFRSDDGLNWSPTKKPLVNDRTIVWEDGKKETMLHLERPQLLFDDNGEPMVLFVACDTDRGHSFNVSIPLKLDLDD